MKFTLTAILALLCATAAHAADPAKHRTVEQYAAEKGRPVGRALLRVVRTQPSSLTRGKVLRRSKGTVAVTKAPATAPHRFGGHHRIVAKRILPGAKIVKGASQ